MTEGEIVWETISQADEVVLGKMLSFREDGTFIDV